MKQRVIIIGYGFSSRLGIIRSLGELGYEIYVIAVEGNKKPIDCYSKYVKKFFLSYGNKSDEILRILLEECTDKRHKPIVIPINDFSASVVDLNLETLSRFFLIPNINNQQGSVVDWMNKEKQKTAARHLGLRVAKSVNVEIRNHSFKIPTEVNYPCFTKTHAYVPGYKHTLHKCNNEEELYEILNRLSEQYEALTLMVEDYKDIEKEFAVVGVSNGDDVIIPGVIEILSMAEGGVKGVACHGIIKPVQGFEDLIELFSKLIKEIGFTGMFDIDFYLSGGEYYFCEINLRIGGSGYAVMKMGVNLPLLFVSMITGNSVENLQKKVTGISAFVNERISSDNWYNCHMSTKSFLKMQKSSQISFVRDKNDPMPYRLFKRQLATLYLKRCIKKWLRRI